MATTVWTQRTGAPVSRVVVDLGLPLMTGFAFIREPQGAPGGRNKPFDALKRVAVAHKRAD